jgi:hypothetical protein
MFQDFYVVVEERIYKVCKGSRHCVSSVHTWCTSIELKKEMDICVAWLKNSWVGNCLNGAFKFLRGAPPPQNLEYEG